jgi:hypothetical protein
MYDFRFYQACTRQTQLVKYLRCDWCQIYVCLKYYPTYEIHGFKNVKDMFLGKSVLKVNIIVKYIIHKMLYCLCKVAQR